MAGDGGLAVCSGDWLGDNEAYIKFVVVAGEAIEEEMSVHLVLEDDSQPSHSSR